MKKVLSLLLVTTFVFSFSACSKENASSNIGSSTTVQTEIENTSGTTENNTINGNSSTIEMPSGNTSTTSAKTSTLVQTESTKNNVENNTTGNSKKINLSNYVSVKFSGKNLAGYASVTFDKEKFLLDNIKKISFNQKNLQVYKELYGNGNEDVSAANAIIKYISVGLDKHSKLSNGDTVKVVWKINTEKVETYFKWDYVCGSKSFTVTGLKDAATFDPFEKLEVTFSGIAPYGTAKAYNFDSNCGGTYKVAPNENLKNGDKVKITFSCSDKTTMIANYGKYPSSFEKTYTVSGLNTYVRSITELSKDQQNKLVSDAREKVSVSGWGTYKEAKYCGNYFYYTKNRTISYTVNAIHFVFEHPEEIGVANSPNMYTIISLSDLQIDAKGDLVYYKHEMSQRYDKYKSKEELNKAFVDNCHDTMSCSNNTKFE